MTRLFRVDSRPDIGGALIPDTSRTAALVFLLGFAIVWRILLSPAARRTLALIGLYVLLVGLG